MEFILNNSGTAQWFLNLFFLSLVFGLICWIALRIKKSFSPPLRSSMALFAMIGILILPFCFSLMPVSETNIPIMVEDVTVAAIETGVTPMSVPVKNNPNIISLLNTAGLIWFMGFLVMLSKYFYGFLKIEKYKKNLKVIDGERIKKMIEQWNRP